MSNTHLEEAFEHRIGKKDQDSFIEVVNAFFRDALDNNALIVPVSFGRTPDGTSDLSPSVLNLDGEKMMIVLSSPEYLENLSTNSHMGIKGSAIINMINESPRLSGIIINPTSEYHCFLPRDGIIGFAKELGILSESST